MSFSTSGIRLAVNAPQVIHETIDGEVIAINLGTGTYYSLKGSAAEAWELIAAPEGTTPSNLVNVLTTRYSAAESEVSSALEAFVSELEGEALVAYLSGRADEVAASSHASGEAAGPPQAFVAPILEKFTDMQDLVLLDPVHEADDLGWPQRADAAAGDQAA